MSDPRPSRRKRAAAETSPPAIDEIDHRLLALLSDDARRSYGDLGAEVGLSAPSVFARVKKLEERGVIRRYTIDLEPALLGLDLRALVAVGRTPGYLWEDLEAQFRELPAIEACFSVTGEDSYQLLVRVGDAKSLEGLLRDLHRLEGVSTTRTSLILTTAFERKRIG